jgi:hypothetical protein
MPEVLQHDSHHWIKSCTQLEIGLQENTYFFLANLNKWLILILRLGAGNEIVSRNLCTRKIITSVRHT